jgi:lipoate-protein ligase A
VKRQAGGTAVFAASNVLGLDIALPPDHPLNLPDIVETYRWLGEVWIRATRALGANSRLISIDEARIATRKVRANSANLTLACFGTLSPYEVAVDRRKLVGLAQVRRRTGTLLQAGIHLRFQASTLAALLTTTRREETEKLLHEAAIGLHEASGRNVSMLEVIQAFELSLVRSLDVELRPGSWTDQETFHVAETWANHDAEQQLSDPD